MGTQAVEGVLKPGASNTAARMYTASHLIILIILLVRGCFCPVSSSSRTSSLCSIASDVLFTEKQFKEQVLMILRISEERKAGQGGLQGAGWGVGCKEGCYAYFA